MKITMYPLEIVLRNTAARPLLLSLGRGRGHRAQGAGAKSTSLKNDDLHDPFVNDDDLVALGIIAPVRIWLRLLRSPAASRGPDRDLRQDRCQAVDFKIKKVGRTSDGTLLLADRVTPRIPAVCGISVVIPARWSISTKDLFRHWARPTSSRPTKKSKAVWPNSPSRRH